MDRIVVGVNGSAPSTAAVVWAAGEAAMRNIELTIVHVLAETSRAARRTKCPPQPIPTQVTNARIARGEKIVDQALGVVARANGSRQPVLISSRLCVGPVVPTLWAFTQEGAHMLVLGRHDRSDKHPARLGSVTGAMLQSARCPVAIVPHVPVSRLWATGAPVVVGVDMSRGCRFAVGAAFDEATRRSAELVAVHAIGHRGTSADAHAAGCAIRQQSGYVLDHALADWQLRYPDVPVRRLVACDYPVQALLDQSRHAQLVVVGATRYGTFAGNRFGGVGSAVARSCQIPTIVTRRKTPGRQPEVSVEARKIGSFGGFQ